MTQEAVLYPGFEGATAFTTGICRPSSTGDVLRYRGVDIVEIVGVRPYDDVWRLLVDGEPGSGALSDIGAGEIMAALRGSGTPRVVLQQLLLELGESRGMAPSRGPGDTAFRDDLAALTTAFSVGLGVLLAQRTREKDVDLAQDVVTGTVADRIVGTWLGHGDATITGVIDVVLSVIAEHGSSASTLASRVVASTGANAAACVSAGLAAIGGPRHGGAARRVVELLRTLESEEISAERHTREAVAEHQRLPGIGHRVYRDRDPRAGLLRRIAEQTDAPLAEAAVAYERAAREAVRARGRDRALPVNVDLWLPVVLDAVGIPDDMMDAVLAAGRMAGWSAHSVEQVESGGKLMRPTDIYVGVESRSLAETLA